MSEDGDPAAERTAESDDTAAAEDSSTGAESSATDESTGAESSPADSSTGPDDASVFGESSAAEASSGPDAEVADLPVDASIVDRVAEHDEDLATDVEALFRSTEDLSDRVADLESERDELKAELEEREEEVEDLTARLKRKQADFENYKKRRERKEAEIRERATEDLVERLLDVRDNLRRAVEEDDDVDGLREGVKMTLGEFDRVLDAENVAAIEPEAGEEVDPQRHEVMMRVESKEPEGTIADVYEPGYEMAEKVLRPAKVAVSED